MSAFDLLLTVGTTALFTANLTLEVRDHGWRRGPLRVATMLLFAAAVYATSALADAIAGALGVLSVMVAIVALTAARVTSVTLLGTLNFVVLQWCGVRLAASFTPRDIPGWTEERITDDQVLALGGRWWSRYAPPRGVRIHWVAMRWIWPLTGWWSAYRWICPRSPYRIARRS